MDSGVLLASAINRARVALIKREARELVVQTWGEWAWHDFDWIIFKESGWNHKATNPTSGAFGICQALPANKMGPERKDWRVQVSWCVDYVLQRYKSPGQAKDFWLAHNWF